MSEDVHLLLGAYILGGLTAAERRVFEEHLDNCPRCRRDVAQAAPLPALLNRADRDEMLWETTAADDHGVAALLHGAQAARLASRRRRRRGAQRNALAGALAAAAVVAVGVLIAGVHAKPPTPGTVYTMVPVYSQAGGHVTLTDKPWGTAITLHLNNLPRSGVFTLRTVDTTGGMQPAANWSATGNGVSVLEGATSIPRPRLRELVVVDVNDTVIASAAV